MSNQDQTVTFKQMSLVQKCVHLGKIVIFICTFGFAFPHAMDAFLK